MKKATDYQISNRDANEIKGVVLLPVDLRQIALAKYVERFGAAALTELFAQFMGLANSVVENNREMIELLGIIEGGDHPYTAEKYNLPTIFGALNGVPLASSINQDKTCGGCAFRLGAIANQCEPTTCDAQYCQSEGEPDFMCHEDLDDEGKPKHLCLGYAQRTKAKARAA
jgi:hypothetical protein